MTDREKTEMLAKWMGHTIATSEPITWSTRGLLLRNTSPTVLGSPFYWWNPQHNIVDAMEIYERLAQVAPPVELVAGQWDGAAVYRLDIPAFLGPDCATIPAAISEAVLAWLEEKG